MLVDVAVAVLEVGNGFAPGAGVGSLGGDVGWDGGPAPVVELDEVRGPFHGVDAARGAAPGETVVGHSTALVLVLHGRVLVAVVAVLRDEASALARAVDEALA